MDYVKVYYSLHRLNAMWCVEMCSSMPLFFGFIFLSAAAAQLASIDSCCRYTQNITVQNSGNDRVTDGRSSQAATFFCALDSGDVTNIDFGFLEQGPGSQKFTLSIYLRAPAKNSLVEEVWSANRNALVEINSTLVFVVGQGLSLVDAGGRLVWSVNASAAGFMLDCTVGNLILFDSGNRTLWQSFDHPTDTQMQGQTLTYGMKLVSRRSTQDPSSGFYTMVMEASGLALYDEFQQPYWWNSTGNGIVTVSSCPGDEKFTSLGIFNTGFLEIEVCNRTFNRNFNSYPSSDNNTLFMKLDELGRLRVYKWNSGNKQVDYDFLESDCALPNYCGKFGICENNGQCSCPDNFLRIDASDSTRGCLLPAGEGNLTCTDPSSPSSREMVAVPDLLSTVTKYSYLNNRNFATAEECSLSCLNNCSCRAVIYDYNSSQCHAYENESRIQSFTKAGGSQGYIKLEKVSSSKRSKAGIIAGVTISFLAVLVAGLILFWLRKKKKKTTPAEDIEEDEEAFLDSLPGLPPRFTMKTLEEATNGFSHKLGHGGFGEVFLGRLNGMQVAVKRLASAHQGKKEFRAEVATIGNIHHVNLVRLRGFCATGSHRLLVYEYMVNGSLDRWLFKVESEERLDWSSRFNIALGTARGLAYLHESCKERILHLDVKPQNILLDEKFVAKVSDFGLAKLMGGEETHVFTTMRGTPGYLAPEWLTSAISDKSDVYSFGVVLLELVSGRHNFRKQPSASDSGGRAGDDRLAVLSLWASSKVDQGRGVDVLEERLRSSVDAEQQKQVETVVSTAIWCVQTDPGMRPSMNTVVLILEGLVKSEKPPALAFDVETSSRVSNELLEFINSSISSTSASSSSAKQMSSSQFSFR